MLTFLKNSVSYKELFKKKETRRLNKGVEEWYDPITKEWKEALYSKRTKRVVQKNGG